LKSNPKCRCSLAPSIQSGTPEEHLDPPIQFGLTCVETLGIRAV
jgi:hypothetical protein